MVKKIASLVMVLGFMFLSLPVFAAPLENGMDASFVLGQDDFVTGSPMGSTTRDTFKNPSNVHIEGTTILVSDTLNSRVLVFDISAGVSSGMEADAVIGQADFISGSEHRGGAIPSANTLSNPSSAIAAEGFYFIADTGNNRVLIYDTATWDGQNATYVLGQADFISNSANQGNLTNPLVNSLSSPRGLAYDETNDLLYIADGGNNRVIVYDLSGGITDGMDATYVLGFSDFTSFSATGSTSQSTFSSPSYIALDEVGERLFIVDRNNRRVLVFDVESITSGESAIHVLGQDDFVTASSFKGSGAAPGPMNGYVIDPASDDGFMGATGISFDENNNRLFVSDGNPSRVLVFDVESITNGESAIHVLGQDDYNNGLWMTTIAGLMFPASSHYDNASDYLYVVDSGNSRIMVYDLSVAPVPSLSYSNFFMENVANDGSLDGSIDIYITDDVFMNVGSTLTLNTHYTLTNAPAGLTPVMTINDDGTMATLTFTGNATNHEDINDVTNLTITFLNGAFTTTATASDVTNYEYTTGSIDFNDAVVVEDETPTQLTRRSSGGQASPVFLAQLNVALEQSQSTQIQQLLTQIQQLQTILTQLQQSSSSDTLSCVPSLRRGSTGSMVRMLQTKLGIVSDGQFGPQTEQSVRTFQQKNNLVVDGIAGKNTCDALK